MIPLRRCGSHALRLRLNMNENFYSPYPLHIVDFKPLVPLYGDLSNDFNFFQFVVDLVGLQSLSMVRWNNVVIEPIKLFEKIRRKPRSLTMVATEILIEAAEQLGKTVVMDKSLDNVHDWREILRLYPKAKFINLVRDPRAQVASMNRAIIHEFDTFLNAKIWAQAHVAARELILAHPKSVLTIRFEDWIEDQEGVLKQVCNFLEFPFSKQMLKIETSDEAKKIARQSQLWESNDSAPIRRYIDKFKSALTEEEIAIVESVTKEGMKTYGYSSLAKIDWKPTPRAEELALSRSHKARLDAWENLRASHPQDYVLRKQRANYLEMCKRNAQNLFGSSQL